MKKRNISGGEAFEELLLWKIDTLSPSNIEASQWDLSIYDLKSSSRLLKYEWIVSIKSNGKTDFAGTDQTNIEK
jgi:hypothetical protein